MVTSGICEEWEQMPQEPGLVGDTVNCSYPYFFYVVRNPTRVAKESEVEKVSDHSRTKLVVNVILKPLSAQFLTASEGCVLHEENVIPFVLLFLPVIIFTQTSYRWL